ncbi:hypothetical protein C2S51_038819 [Perilla frutescens var. frutescens]|nr:hypothetical protein C2S51_038819 [Perilla frutescens var. frutescens]
MVVVDQSSHSKHAMMWALTHVTNKGDILTLLHLVSSSSQTASSSYLASSLASLCKACKPEVSLSLSHVCVCVCVFLEVLERKEICSSHVVWSAHWFSVEVEALAIQGPKMDTVMSQVKKLEVSVLVLGQKLPSPFLNCMFLRSSTDEFVEKCINSLECLTIGVRKQSNGVSGYLISTRWHKNFWLLA